MKKDKEPDVQEIIKKMKMMHEELTEKLDVVYKESGLTHSEIQEYLSNPKNFTKASWQYVQMNREHLQQKIWSLIGEEGKKNVMKKESEKTARERKAKTLGARKKGWIPMK